MSTSPEEQARTMIANLPEKTGRSLEAWLALVAATSLAKHGEILKWLKSTHGMSHGFANLVAHKALQSDAGSQSDEALVAAQYEGAKAELRPIYDAILRAVSAFGPFEVAPKKTYVSLRRRKQFAIVQPSTKTRVDLGINLHAAPTSARLEASGSFNAMVSHRVRLESIDAVDDELVDWLRLAWQQA